MKNLIRKILKEEFDSENFDWVSLDIDPIREFIYQKLKKMGLNTNEIEVLVKDTLYDTHKRKVDIASYGSISGQKRLYETHKRKVNITTPTTIINGTIF